MIATSDLFAAYLKCSTKCFLRSLGQVDTTNDYANWLNAQNELYLKEGLGYLAKETASDESDILLPDTDPLKNVKWRLAINLVARTENARLRRNQTVKGNLYLIEEPTIGLHPADVARLVDVLHRLVDDGHTVVVIEHNLDIMAEADCIIDIGPEAGSEGGEVVAFGTPEEVAKSKESRTAPFLAGVLNEPLAGD